MQITKRAAMVTAATFLLAVGGIGAATYAAAGPRTDQGRGCPDGYTAREVPVAGYTLWACARPGGTTPAPTATVTSTVTVTVSVGAPGGGSCTTATGPATTTTTAVPPITPYVTNGTTATGAPPAS